MRMTNFLRSPIRADHQTRMLNLQVSEQPLAGDPLPGDPYPQTLQISFETGETEVQLAALWKGVLRFVPDSTTRFPQSPQDVREENFSGWQVVGDLVLTCADFSLLEPFKTHIKLIATPPSLVRYSKVRLTREFIFSTIQQVHLPVRMVEGYQVIILTDADPLWHQKLALAFMHGKAGIRCPMDPADPAGDFTNNPMPSVALTEGARNTFNVTVSSRAAETLWPFWFNQRPEYDDIPGMFLVHEHMAPAGSPTTAQGAGATVLIDTSAEFQTRGVKAVYFVVNLTDGSWGVVTAVDAETQLHHTPLMHGTSNEWKTTDTYQVSDNHNQFYNPAHPGHSIIPLGAIFTTADDEAFEDQHRNSILQAAILGLHETDTPYRRIDIARPPRPGPPVSSKPRRPFPQYQLNWEVLGGYEEIPSLRLPLNGHVYIPLEDDEYWFWAVPRGGDPDDIVQTEQLQLSIKRGDRKYIDLPSGELLIDIEADSTKKIFAHLFDFDSNLTWHAFAALNRKKEVLPLRKKYAKKHGLKNDAGEGWKLPPQYLYLWGETNQKSTMMETYKPFYGHIVAAAGRHEIAPEFLQAVVMAEGLYWHYIRPLEEQGQAYSTLQEIDAVGGYGLDKVGGQMWNKETDEPLTEDDDAAKGVPGLKEADPTGGYYKEWIEKKYIDPVFEQSVANFRYAKNEAGPVANCDIVGYKAAIEWTAVLLNWGLFWMKIHMPDYMDEPPMPITTEEQKRFLAHLFFNTYDPETREPYYTKLTEFMKPWGNWWDPEHSTKCNAHIRIAVAELLEELRIYR